MKKLFIYTGLFLLPMLLLVCLLPIDRRLAYAGLEGDCFNHGIWVHDRIFEQGEAIDIAFLGSSHTLNGVDDSLISDKLPQVQAANLGYCRLGRNLTYVLVKELLRAKEPQHIIIEIREHENRYSHPIFPYLGRTQDVVLPYPFFNPDILPDIWTHLAYKIEILQDGLYRSEQAPPIQLDLYGFGSSADTAEAGFLADIKSRRSQSTSRLSDEQQAFYDTYALGYLQKIADVCREKGVRLSFLYLPGYGAPLATPSLYETYLAYGEIFLPPDSILQNPAFWFDEGHLNQTGAKQLSTWLGEKL